MRLQRWGRRNLPFYRIVIADSRSPRDGRFIERIGTYNPLPSADNVKEITANSDRVRYWLACGAQPSDRVRWLLGKLGLAPTQPMRMSTKHLSVPKSLTKKT